LSIFRGQFEGKLYKLLPRLHKFVLNIHRFSYQGLRSGEFQQAIPFLKGLEPKMHGAKLFAAITREASPAYITKNIYRIESADVHR